MMLDIARRADRAGPFVEILRIEAGLRSKLGDRQPLGSVQRAEHSGLVAELGHEEAQSTRNIADHLADEVVENGFVNCLGHGKLQLNQMPQIASYLALQLRVRLDMGALR